MVNKLEFQEVINENYRVYTFPHGKIQINNVVKICVRPSGTHRLETKTGEKFIVNSGWLAIEVSADNWTI